MGDPVSRRPCVKQGTRNLNFKKRLFTKNAIELEVVSGKLPLILSLIFGLQQPVLVGAGGVAENNSSYKN